ncbi:type IV secretion system protein [Succinivibrio dextrinosolvens]|uniref:type IV secretion system protein n=1 Tax=Succinivibrio dextrinosolvens TaxID=83771 RepID=UPI00241F796F|nr:type IV secretion system protein [Succinivibrio dextrinosolvens]MBE6422565.1 hypothetical protein [Succinivibrio dextrinosolvens]
MFLKKKALILALSGLFLSQVNAAVVPGIPVFDGSNLTQNLTNYIQDLKNYSQYLTDYQKQLQMYERQVKDATRPYTEVFNDIYTGFNRVRQIADGISNMKSNYNSTMEYIKANYGDSEFWKNCVLTGCDPTSQLVRGFDSVMSNFEYTLGVSNASLDSTQKSLEQIKNLENKISSSGDAGISENLQTIGKLQAQVAQINAEASMTMNQFVQAQMAAQIQEDRQGQAAIKEASRMLDASGFGVTSSKYGALR